MVTRVYRIQFLSVYMSDRRLLGYEVADSDWRTHNMEYMTARAAQAVAYSLSQREGVAYRVVEDTFTRKVIDLYADLGESDI